MCPGDEVQIVFDSKREQLLAEQQRMRSQQVQMPLYIPPLIPGAEDVLMINEMLILKEETLQYLRLHFNPSRPFPELPAFYSANVYWIFARCFARNHEPIYLKCLGEVVKCRINELFPSSVGKIAAPSLNEIVRDYRRINEETTSANPELAHFVVTRLEHWLGEAYRYIKRFLELYEKSPASPQFIIAFLSVHYMTGSQNITGEQIYSVIERLKRNLPNVHPEVFFKIQQALDGNIRVIDQWKAVRK